VAATHTPATDKTDGDRTHLLAPSRKIAETFHRSATSSGLRAGLSSGRRPKRRPGRRFQPRFHGH
jgi:hypothetical protein